jgi:hypothetical protein
MPDSLESFDLDTVLPPEPPEGGGRPHRVRIEIEIEIVQRQPMPKPRDWRADVRTVWIVLILLLLAGWAHAQPTTWQSTPFGSGTLLPRHQSGRRPVDGPKPSPRLQHHLRGRGPELAGSPTSTQPAWRARVRHCPGRCARE